MSHPGSVDIIDFLAFTIYPFIALGIIELISRGIKLPSWKKLSTQGIAMIILSVIYVIAPAIIVTREGQTHVEPLWLSLIHISEPTRRTPISYAVFCLKK